MPRLSAIDFGGPLAPGTAGDELDGCACGLCRPGGNWKPAGNAPPPTAGPGDCIEGGCRGPGVAGPCLETEKAFILAMISAFMGVEPVRAGGGFPRAAFRVPSGVEELDMWEVVAVTSDAVRGARPGCDGLLGVGDCGSASGVLMGEVGGESAGEGCSPGDAMMGWWCMAWRRWWGSDGKHCSQSVRGGETGSFAGRAMPM